MNLKNLIDSKINGKDISQSDIESLINAFVNNKINDKSMTVFLKAVQTHGMTTKETIALTNAMLNSGERIEFPASDNYIADKHSTGGVGDKVSLILGPLLAAGGLTIPMLAGRSLAHTGGTIDKLESIPGFQTNLSTKDFKNNVEEIGICIMSQTDSICPADKKMYALRDVTDTINSVPLICGSIMSKKIAEGIDGLVLDIKIGNGAFMKTIDQGIKLGSALQNIGKTFDVKTDVVYSSMDQPLGKTAGMWCEVKESIEALKGKGASDLMHVVFELGSKLLVQAGISNDSTAAVSIQKDLIASGKAYNKFEDMVRQQKGSINKVNKIHSPKYEQIIFAHESGFIEEMDSLNIGWATVELGCGRKAKPDILDPSAGIDFIYKIGDEVKMGDPIFKCFNSNKQKLLSATKLLNDSIKIGPNQINHSLFF